MRELIKSFQEIEQINSESLKENANVDGYSPLGKMNTFASETCKWYTDEFLLTEATQQAQKDNILYIHDKDFYPTGTTTCSQIPLDKLLKNGFYTGHGHIRAPKTIQSALSLAAIILQSNQNNQHGGQSFQKFDYDLAPFVRKSFEKSKQHLIDHHKISFSNEKELQSFAWEQTRKETFQACEAFIHNANSMHSRGGGQVPFVSINYGTDTSYEGRMLIEQLLKATRNGLGNGETPIFPIQIFKVKDGVNALKDDPNFDLFQQAVNTTSQRLFPNFSFLDAPFNQQYFNGEPETEVAYMGCRTRVMGNIHGDETAEGRGNLSFSSLNLVRLALLSEGEVQVFWNRLSKAINLAIQQLIERYHYQSEKISAEFPFLFSQGIWKGGELLRPDEKVKDVIKQGTLSIGFIGLAEALTVLTGTHHGQSKKSWELGKEIIAKLRQATDKATDDYQLNFGVIATPAEGLSGKFINIDREKFGEIEGVTDRGYYTNSFHIPVHFQLSIQEKIRLEAPFHALCNAGHITYVEIDGNANKNPQALMQIINYMKETDIGYGSINHPIDHCLTCGYQGEINQVCPSCGETDLNHLHHIRRITGYLVGDMKRWNKAKQKEESSRVKHQ